MTDDGGQMTEISGQRSEVSPQSSALSRPSSSNASSAISRQTLRISLLTGGSDRPYALGLTSALTSAGISVDFIGSDELNLPELLQDPRVNFLNFRGDQSAKAGLAKKIVRVLAYYWRLVRYAVTARPKIFHILWNNKFELFDRTLLIVYYKVMGRNVVLTAHNVNIRKRDRTDTWVNRFSLVIQYQLVDHIFVHTKRMKRELFGEFGVPENKISVIPFGINNTVPDSKLTAVGAKRMLGINGGEKVMLCFGQIAPYKGLEYAVAALTELSKKDRSYRLIIAGKPKWNATYWEQIEQLISENGVVDRVVMRIGHVPDEETELYFKAADVLILPYTAVFQSGVLFLSYSFGLPVIASDVASLKEEIIEDETGSVFRAQDASDLALKIERYFQSDLFRNLETRRPEIKRYANERYSWDKVAGITTVVYRNLLS
jgi:glycosyltransferase involved in cell wall biosynthesis